ncbi:hypothetical protein [Mycobacterium paraense]|uniref:hypothetical protein n=1 Tax=Mycobacterium paraense TaxID=767916 RepID=UPI00111BDC2D|nr:hypothetical protein [Mycobacterium paraense]
MEQVNSAASCRSCGTAVVGALYYFPIPSAVVLGSLVIGLVILWRRVRSSPDSPTDEKPPLTGTAEVLSLEFTKTVKWDRPVARIELRVHTPGSEPYVTVVKEPIGPEQVDAGVRLGKTIAVAVDSADPQRVRLEPPYGAPPLTSGQRRFQTIAFWTVITVVPAAIVSLMIAGIVTGHLYPF